jgi:hypothetical protein
VSANCRAAANKLVEYEGEMIPAIEKARRIAGEKAAGTPVQHWAVFKLEVCSCRISLLLLIICSEDPG